MDWATTSLCWDVFIRSGRVRAWCFASSTRFVWDGSDGLDGGPVTDGLWHHVAFTVDASGGKLYVDGVLKDSQAWTGAAGASTTTQEVRFGINAEATIPLNGRLDEISIWRVALNQSQIQSLMTNSPTGAEANLLAYYSCDEGSGSAVGDSAPLDGNNNGTWVGTPRFIPNGLFVETLPASSLTQTSAVLNALADPGGASAVGWFEWGFTTNYDNVTPPQPLGSANAFTNFSEALTNFIPGVSYHFRAIVSNSVGVVFGADQSFPRLAQRVYVKASNTGVNDVFGTSIAMSGNTLVVGASGEDSNATGVNGDENNNSASNSGAAYVFVRNGDSWVQQAYLKASNTL
jgi:hypothetical protein